MTVALVVNPFSAAGRTGRRLEELESLARDIFGDVRVRTTESPGDGARQARAAIADGCELLIAVGGDGTVNEVVNGILGSPGDAVLGVVPAGTGSDFVRTLGMPSIWSEALRAVADGRTERIDAFDVRYHDRHGKPHQMVGINVVGIGMAGDVVARANRSSKRLGGTLTFALSTVSSLLAWRSPEVTLEWEEADGRADGWRGPLSNIFLGNASYCGGGMKVAPDAVLDDGLFELVVIPDLGTWTLASSAHRLYTGTIQEVPGVITRRVRSLRAISTTGAEVPVDVDGEGPGVVPVDIRCLPGSLGVRRPLA